MLTTGSSSLIADVYTEFYENISVPFEAIHFLENSLVKFDERFAIINGEHAVQQLTVTNLLSSDENLGGTLHYVDLEIGVYDEAEFVSLLGEKVRLAPYGATGSEKTINLLNLKNDQLYVRGTAVYEGGSFQDIPQREINQLVIKITSKDLY